MNSKRKWLFRGCTLLIVLLIAAWMFVIGRGHTVYIDNKTLEYNGETYGALQRVEVYVGGERLSKLAKRERTMSAVIGQKFETRLVNTVEKGDEPTETVIQLTLPYGSRDHMPDSLIYFSQLFVRGTECFAAFVTLYI